MARPRCLDGIKQWDAVRIDWDDAAVGDNGWQSLVDLVADYKDGNVSIQSVGLVIHLGEENIILTTNYDVVHGTVNSHTSIPYVNIRKAIKLKAA